MHSRRRIVDQIRQIGLPADLVERAHILQLARQRHIIDGIVAILQPRQGIPDLLMPHDEEVIGIQKSGDAQVGFRLKQNRAEQSLLRLHTHREL